MPSPQIERKLAAIMFTDIAGYTALSAKDSTKASELLTTQRDTLKPIVEKHGGSWMKEIGDGLLLTFDSATSAVECSIAIQEATKDIEDLNLRIGIHEGEVIKQDGDVIGDDVNVASRIEPFSAVGGVAISHKIQQAISSNQEFETKYIGKPKLKGVAQKVEVYCITSHGLPETDVSKVSAKLEEESNFNIFAITGGILTAIGIAFWIAVGVFDVSFGGKKEVPSIAILPLDNKGDEEDEFYAYGISSELISDVTSAGLIRVASQKDIEKLDYTALNNEELSEKLFVRYIAQGTLWKIDSLFQLSMELYDTKTSKVLWSESWQKSWNKLSSIKGNLADNILKTLKVSTKQDIAKESTSNTEAYKYFLEAKYIYEKREDMKDTEIARGLLQKAIDLDDNLIKAKTSLGWTYYETGDYDKAMDIYENSLKQAKVLGDKKGIATSLGGIGIVYLYKGDSDKSLEYLTKSLKILEELEDQSGIGQTFGYIGSIYAVKGDLDTALDYYERSLAIKEELGNKRGMGNSLNGIGNVHKNKGDYDKALDFYDKSIKIKEEIGNKDGISKSLHNIGGIHHKKGNYDKALDYHIQSLEIEEELGDKYSMGASLKHIGKIWVDKGDYDKSLGYFIRSLKLFEEIGHKVRMGMSNNYIGDICQIKGDYDKALDYYTRSLKIADELGDKYSIGHSLMGIGLVYADIGDHDKAEEHLEKSLAIQKEIGFKVIELVTTTHLYLAYKNLEKTYDIVEIHKLITDEEEINNYLNYALYQLLEDTSYLETAYNQVQEKANNLEPNVKTKFLSYPIPKAIVEEWEKVK